MKSSSNAERGTRNAEWRRAKLMAFAIWFECRVWHLQQWIDARFPKLSSRMDRIRWFLEGVSGRLFVWAYDGSQQEIQDSPEVPEKYRTKNQHEVMARWDEFEPMFEEGGAHEV
jgi:hypothetical protein